MPAFDICTTLIRAGLVVAASLVTAIAPSTGLFLAAQTATAAEATAQQPKPALGQSFADPEQAAAALVTALRAGKLDAVKEVLGPGTDKLLSLRRPLFRRRGAPAVSRGLRQ